MVRTSVGVVLTSLSPTPSPQLLRNTTACIVVTQPSTAGIILSTCPDSRKVQYQACFLQSSNRYMLPLSLNITVFSSLLIITEAQIQSSVVICFLFLLPQLFLSLFFLPILMLL